MLKSIVLLRLFYYFVLFLSDPMRLKKTLLVLSLAALSYNAYGQKQINIDSLLVELEKSPNIDKYDILLEISSYYNESNPDFDKALIYIDSAIRLSEMSENEAFKAKCLNKKGIIYYKQSDCTYSNQVYQSKFVVVN
ncbi:MAG: hypothetical protein DRI83_07015 [Bacteroidetes bacterium]|nr:MAG: hypothetical protein DRI83_07015 [Bacteroidota bacterium]